MLLTNPSHQKTGEDEIGDLYQQKKQRDAMSPWLKL